VRSAEHADALARVCELHAGEHRPSAHLSTAEFPAAAQSPGAARRFVDQALQRWGIDGLVLEHVRLVTSELATNAVVHAAGRFAVTVRALPDAVRIAVDDPSLSEPVMRSRPPGAPAGRGLHVIAALAQEWGVEVTAHGKRVWADVPLSG
jgi:anti-sigma regulatory factor (Ser/Thr protein kinase)